MPHRSRRFFRNKTPDACFVLKPSFMCRQKFMRADLLRVRQYVSVADRPCAQRITPRFTSVLWLIVGAEPARYTCLPASATTTSMTLQRIGQRAAITSMASGRRFVQGSLFSMRRCSRAPFQHVCAELAVQGSMPFSAEGKSH